ncbi:MAG: GTPase HflX [Actinomycetota bacterium]
METESTIDRILRRGASAPANEFDGDQLDLEARESLRRVAGLSTELEDISEVEYRQLRLEKVVLIGIWGSGTLTDAENSLRELAALAETAGAEVLDGVLQRRAFPDPSTYLGKGKAQELRDLVRAVGADTVIANTELAPSQRRALEDVVKVKVVDRTAIILDIFAQHAKSREGKAQVELAQLEYLLPRLRGWGESMSRQAGGQAAGGMGIGSRGPGETKIELDRRRINTKMAKLRKEIAGMKSARDTMRSKREKSNVPQVAIAGYTNAGKSSLLNRMTKAGVLVENALFATLDPTVRQHETPDGRGYTLEEISHADLIVHVVDGTDPDPLGQIRTVHEVIAEVEASSIPEQIVFNKADLLSEEDQVRLRGLVPGCLLVSARTGMGFEDLELAIANGLPKPDIEFYGVVPYSRGDLVSRAHISGKVLQTEYVEEGTKIHAFVKADLAAELKEFAKQS